MTYCDYSSPLGDLVLAATSNGLSGIWFHVQKHFGTPINVCEALAPRRSAAHPMASNILKGIMEKRSKQEAILEATRRWLDQYFSGEIPNIHVPIDLSAGTPFQQSVWQEIAKIPYGQTITYGDIARAIGRPKGAQAVGQAVGRNPVSIIVPCHRVMGAHGAMTGYAAGIPIKERLLELEGVLARHLE
ncbi:MAG: methylated-DNA--[protein]-cysteine S-methyltransferase [Bacteroidales bacterium]|nr:methylated-DNA--[protein]-cysteine S-methyltransferase [Bacteroidales bacterium]